MEFLRLESACLGAMVLRLVDCGVVVWGPDDYRVVRGIESVLEFWVSGCSSNEPGDHGRLSPEVHFVE